VQWQQAAGKEGKEQCGRWATCCVKLHVQAEGKSERACSGGKRAACHVYSERCAVPVRQVNPDRTMRNDPKWRWHPYVQRNQQPR